MKNIIRTPETHPLTWRLRDDKQPVWLDEYRSKNGYEGARKALTGLSPDEIVNQVKDAGLKGRGGAGFSTGLKWSLMPKDESMNIRYLLCNADEMEPGTYKDRLLMEQLPHLLVEGMLISAFALKASFSALTFGSRFFIELTTTNFRQNTCFFAGTLEATQSYVERLVFTYFNYRHVPLTFD